MARSHQQTLPPQLPPPAVCAGAGRRARTNRPSPLKFRPLLCAQVLDGALARVQAAWLAASYAQS
eukprot:62446-Chlamydomonas_euryale.AAC.1